MFAELHLQTSGVWVLFLLVFICRKQTTAGGRASLLKRCLTKCHRAVARCGTCMKRQARGGDDYTDASTVSEGEHPEGVGEGEREREGQAAAAALAEDSAAARMERGGSE